MLPKSFLPPLSCCQVEKYWLLIDVKHIERAKRALLLPFCFPPALVFTGTPCGSSPGFQSCPVKPSRHRPCCTGQWHCWRRESLLRVPFPCMEGNSKIILSFLCFWTCSTGEVGCKWNSGDYCEAVVKMPFLSELVPVFIGIFFSLANSKSSDKLQEDTENSSKS